MNFQKLKSGTAKYQAIHKWIARELGKADHCSVDITHKSTRYHWSNISGYYKWDVSDWQMLCPGCHHKFDWREETREIKRMQAMGNTNRRLPVVAIDNKKQVSYYFESILEGAKTFNILSSSITNCLKGRTKTSGKLEWQYGGIIL